MEWKVSRAEFELEEIQVDRPTGASTRLQNRLLVLRIIGNWKTCLGRSRWRYEDPGSQLYS